MDAAHASWEGTFEVALAPDAAFPFFSPDGERAWVPGWDPVTVHAPEGRWGEGMVFVTEESGRPAYWVVARHDRARREVTYYRTEPGRLVARVHVTCYAAGAGRTRVTVTYTFVSLGRDGDEAVRAMDRRGYEEKMRRWQAWIAEAVRWGRIPAC